LASASALSVVAGPKAVSSPRRGLAPLTERQFVPAFVVVVVPEFPEFPEFDVEPVFPELPLLEALVEQ
jgi:hypothetical protein